jgi:hypothetical protein
LTDVAVTVELLIRGWIQALDQSGNLHRYASPQNPLIATRPRPSRSWSLQTVLLIRPGVRRDLTVNVTSRSSASRPSLTVQVDPVLP